MPNRIVRENILTSEAVSSLAWAEEVLYRRLMSIVDDYGRHEANPQLLRSKCYPLQTDAVRVADITRWMAACQKAGLVVLYEVQGKQYLEVSKFGQQLRSPSKHPPPPSPDIRCNQPISDAPVFVSVSVSEDVSDAPAGADGFDQGWDEYPKRPGNSKADALKAWKARLKEGHKPETMIAGVKRYAAYCKAEKTEPKYVKQAATFFGPGLHFLDEWKAATEAVAEPSRAAEETAAMLARQAEHAAKATRPPAELLALVGKAVKRTEAA